MTIERHPIIRDGRKRVRPSSKLKPSYLIRGGIYSACGRARNSSHTLQHYTKPCTTFLRRNIGNSALNVSQWCSSDHVQFAVAARQLPNVGRTESEHAAGI